MKEQPRETVLVPGASRYAVDRSANFWSCCHGRWAPLRPRWVGGGRRRQHLAEPGYLNVVLYGDDGRKRDRRIHHLMLETFVGPRPPGLFALHNDGDKANNRLDNLRWGTPLDNAADLAIHGGGSPKLTASEIAEIRSSPDRKCDLARRFGVDRITIWKVQNGRSWVGR